MTARPTGLNLWWQAIRPKTLGMAASPVVLASALAWAGDSPIAHPEVPIVILLCALAIQAGTNLFNDAQDFLNGTDDIDGAERLGPPRVTALGWALPHQVSAAGLTAFLIALLGGLYLITIGGWPIFFLGLGSLWAGYLYSHGPYPISRSPFGELVVIAFFGVAAVSGTYYLHTGHVGMSTWIWGIAMGLPAGAVLLLNNVRDEAGDRLAGRKTLAILIGVKASHALYAILVLAPYGVSALSVATGLMAVGALLGIATLPLALRNARTFRDTAPSASLNPLLGATVRCQGLFAISTALGLFASLYVTMPGP
ncbi:1,4-dihydroxy-2-naphthoate octaprenyltransferase [Magnetovibrio sp.]|uniref:1,4-dihydroxy-2-naphthoate octaprenyltransferase n=1 Tax=Magnetovibrio sp. TaxID=2024836 RepID=UPI002F93E5BC